MMKNILFLVALILGVQQLKGQYDFGLYNQSLAPHRYRINPAFAPKAKFFLGLPAISNTSVSYGNDRFSYRDLIAKREGNDSIYIDLDNFLSKRGDAGTISFGLNTDLLSFGFKAGKFDFNFSASEIVQGKIRLRTDLFRLVALGNAPSIGEGINPGDFAIRLEHYREHALGVSRSFGSKWRGGLRVKYLYGYEHAEVERSTVSLTTDPVTFDLSGNSDILINTSGLAFEDFSVKNYLLGRKNRGWGLDLGLTYMVTQQLELSASALNLGRIRWNDEVKNYANNVKPVTFQGIELNQFFGDGADNLDDKFQDELDSLTKDFKIEESEERYTQALLPVFFTSAKYALGTKQHVMAAFRAEPYRKQAYSSFSLGYSKQFGSILELNAQWVYANRSAKNIGLGFALNFGITNLVLGTDNIFGMLNPYESRNVNARVGLTMLTGYSEKSKRRKDQDQDGVRDSEDECPTEAGSVLLKGCPDKDSDGVADKNDNCPLEPGLALFKGCPDDDRDSVPNKLDKCPLDSGLVYLKGCPDKDRDSIADGNDKCPELAGLAYFDGCPDSDNDSIPDLEDKCPNEAGLKLNGGCPDRDKDGIVDALDKCPDQPGSASQGGCPFVDTDGDGIKNDEDACPEIAGPIENKGCPFNDSDGDSVTDALDHCPTVPGVPENNGCPQLKKEEAIVLNAAFDNLEFETGKAVIKSSSFKALNDLAKLLDDRSLWKLLVSGHTDNVGSEKSNMTLSKARAGAVKDFLTKAGIDASRIETKAYGPNRPLADNTTAEGRQKNRRVELTVLQE